MEIIGDYNSNEKKKKLKTDGSLCSTCGLEEKTTWSWLRLKWVMTINSQRQLQAFKVMMALLIFFL